VACASTAPPHRRARRVERGYCGCPPRKPAGHTPEEWSTCCTLPDRRHADAGLQSQRDRVAVMAESRWVSAASCSSEGRPRLSRVQGAAKVSSKHWQRGAMAGAWLARSKNRDRSAPSLYQRSSTAINLINVVWILRRRLEKNLHWPSQWTTKRCKVFYLLSLTNPAGSLFRPQDSLCLELEVALSFSWPPSPKNFNKTSSKQSGITSASLATSVHKKQQSDQQ
jgi:hypothetical protein